MIGYGLPDHLYVAVFGIAHPVLGYLSFRRLLARIDRGHEPDRPAIYLQSMAVLWLLLAAGLGLWFGTGRPPAGLGLVLVGSPFLAAGVLVTLACAGLLLAQVCAASLAESRVLERYRSGFGRMRALVPHDVRELRFFYALSFTAGVVEEILWRGYLIGYLAVFMPLWLASIVATVAFGLAHAYQGLEALPRITLVGALFTLLYVATGSLLLPIVLHTTLDALQGRLAWTVNVRLRPAGAFNTAIGGSPGSRRQS